MPRNGSGTYTIPSAAFVAGTKIASAPVNLNFSDLATAMTDSVAADGQTSMTGALLGFAGSDANPGITFASDNTTGFSLPSAGTIDVSCAGVKIGSFNSSGWTGATSGSGTVPTGTLMPFAGSSGSLPAGWLLCSGQSVSQVTYSALFAVVGTTYGGSGGNFNVPDLRGRAVAGLDNMGGTAASRLTSTVMTPDGQTLGATGGTQTVTLTTAQLAVHSHANSLTDPGHHHTTKLAADISVSSGVNSTGVNTGTDAAGTVSATTGITITNANAGSGSAHSNTQPCMVMNYIIKT